LPEKNTNYRRLYAYLNKTRFIDVNITNDMVNNKNLYEEKEHNNCVFLGRDKDGEVKYCLKVGTNTFIESANVLIMELSYLSYYFVISDILFYIRAKYLQDCNKIKSCRYRPKIFVIYSFITNRIFY